MKQILDRDICLRFLLILILPLTACSGSASEPASDRVTIAFMTLPMEPAGVWEDLIAAFEEANPNIHIELHHQHIPDDWPMHADVALGFGLVWYQEAVEQGWMLDLAPLIESDPEFGTGDFYPGVLELHQQDGHIWAIPVSEGFEVLVYRPDIFQEVGTPLPGPEWTWADMLEAAQRLSSNSPEQERCSFFDQADVLYLLSEWIIERSGELYQEKNGSIVPALDRPDVRQALSDYTASAAEVTAPQNANEQILVEEALDRVAQGEVGMTFMHLSAVADYLEQYPKIAIAPLPPGGAHFHHGVYSASELTISAGTAHPQAAWRWVRFLSRQHLGRGDLPARRSVAELNGVWDQMSTEVAEVIHTSLENQSGHSRRGLSADLIYVYNAMNTALVSVLEDQTDIGTALAEAQQEALSEIRLRQEQRSSMTPVPVSVLAPPSSTETTIDFQVSSRSQEQLCRAAAETFESEHPGWHVKVSLLGPGKPSDCLATYVDGSALAGISTWSLLAELDPLAELNQFSKDDFMPQAVAAATWQGKLYAVPSTVKPLVLYYNSYIFQRAGLEPPSSDWTVGDVLEAAEQIAAAGQQDFGYLPRGKDVPFLLEQQEVLLFTDDNPPRPRFTSPKVVQSLRRLQQLGLGQVDFPLPFSEMISLIRDGRVGMWFDVFDYRFEENQSPDVRVTAIQMRPETSLPMQVGVFGIITGGQHSQKCWEWINFLAQQGTSLQDELPALRRLVESEATRQKLGRERFEAYIEMLSRDEEIGAQDATAVEDWATWWFLQALQEAENDSLETSLEAAQDKAEKFVTCLGPSGAQDLDQAQMCAEQADPDHPLAHLAP